MDKITEQMKICDQLYKEQEDFYRKAGQWSGLPGAAHWILYRLCAEEEAISQSDLCKDWYYSKQTINSAVVKLISQNYVELKVQSGKGHRKYLVLTEEGIDFSRKYIQPLLDAERKSFEVLTDSEREMLIVLMKKQLAALNKEAEELWQ